MAPYVTRKPVLVTAATGKTGRHVVAQLARAGVPVRALAHRDDERASHLTSLGAEVVFGDFLDIGSLRTALAGIERAYFCHPPADRLLEASTNFAVAARDAGVEVVVNLSQIHAREGHPSPLTQQHWLAERVLDWADIGTTHLRSTFFAEVYLLVHQASIAAEGRFYVPHGDGRHAPVACEDVARVAVGVLLDERSHAGQTYTVTGPRALTQHEIAAVFSGILERPVSYIDVPLEPWRREAEALGFPPFLVEHLACAAQDLKDGLFATVTDVVAEVGGLPPQSFDAFVRAHVDSFEERTGVEHATQRR